MDVTRKVTSPYHPCDPGGAEPGRMHVTRKVTSSAVPIGYTRGALQGAFPREGNRESGASVFLKNTFRFLASSSQRAVYRISRGPSPDAPRSSVASRLSGCVLRYLSRHTHSTTAVGRGPARIRRSRSCTSLPSSDWDLLPAYSCFGIRMVVHEAGRPRPGGRKEQKRIGRWGTMWACMWGTSGQTVPGVCVLADKVCAPLRLLLNYLFRVRALPFACELCRPEDATWMRSPSDV